MSDFVVRPFAFMRLTHEALRSGFAAIRAAAEAGDIDAARAEFDALREVIALHARQEEEVFFPMLDRLFDGAVTNAQLREAHVREDGHQEQLVAALNDRDADALRAAVAAWEPSFERHLTDEEDVMMPLTEKVADTLEGRAAAVREIIDTDWDGLRTTQLPYVVKALHDHKPYGPLRMFVAALQLATGDRFSELEAAIRGSVGEEKASLLRQHGHLS